MKEDLKYKRALKVIQDRKEAINKDMYVQKPCICCGDEVKLLRENEYPKWDEQERAYYNGIVDKVAAGYGSKHDLSCFYLAICDSCITEKLNDSHLINTKEIRKQYKSKYE